MRRGQALVELAVSLPLLLILALGAAQFVRLALERSGLDAATAAALVASGEVRMDDLITHTFPLARVNEAVELVRERRAPAWLVNVEVSPSHIGGHSA